MKKFYFFSFLILLIGISNTASQPKLVLHLTGGYSLPLPDLKGDIPSEAGDNDYQMAGGVCFGTDAIYFVDKKTNFGIKALLGYNMFSNSGDMTIAQNVTETHKLNILTAGLGVQYNLRVHKKIIPFIGADFTVNFFNGKVTHEGSGISATVENTMKQETRFGVQLTAGTEYSLSRKMGLTAGIRYHLANLIGKKAPTDYKEFALWDGEYTYHSLTETHFVPAKSIQYIQFYLGVSFIFAR